MINGWRAWLIGLICLGFSVISILLILAGDGSARPTGLATLLFFGGAGVGLLASEVGRRRSLPTFNGFTQLPTGAHVPAIVIQASRAQPASAVFMLACWALATTIFAIQRDGSGRGTVMGVIAVLLWATLLFAAPRLRRAPLSIAMTKAGIQQDGYGQKTYVPWSAITSAGLFTIGRNPFFGVTVNDKEAVVETTVARNLGWLNRPLTGHDVTFTLRGYRDDPETIASLIGHYVANPDDRHRIGQGPLPVSVG